MFTLPRRSELERDDGATIVELVGFSRVSGPLTCGMIATGLAMRSSTPWLTMTLLTATIFFSFKWWILQRATAKGLRLSLRGQFAFLLLWAGMNPTPFGVKSGAASSPRMAEWIEPLAKTLLGAALVWIVVPQWLDAAPMAAAWAGMSGLILLLHCGLFHLAALAWRSVGLDVEPIMDRPATAKSLAEFWGRRWNRAFRFVADELVYRPLARRVGPQAALAAAFLFSGIVHDLAISMPARGGYGLPTLYFLIQGAALLFVHTAVGRRFGLQRGMPARLWAIAVIIGPLGLLAHPQFIQAVMLPLLRAVQLS